ncbi:hypothetical protein MIZ03_2732 [Rhodoferax lithotrophicus]|uniref:Uncharacterized protein n=1 Tax=Rhodoferax lithotrophicus TaxID=2798804 RepID=A0ABM7MNI9_9BURK|nr:hypothetical protein [Rhodoferax sp. MIZ03]BCO27841.1 hypothetical protein MIZ03_2732 [Rhodoferax sp. MIZ03]
MDVILDESSLAPCDGWSPSQRIQTMALTLKALDQLGCARVLRSVRTAADEDIGQGRGLRGWCFDKETNRDAGMFIAQRLGKQPFIDGADGLFAAVEGERAIEGSVRGVTVVGLAFAAITGNASVALGSTELPRCESVEVDLTTLDVEENIQEVVQVCCVVTEDDVLGQSGPIKLGIEGSVVDGHQLLARACELFPRLHFGPRAVEQIGALTGSEPVFHQLFRHLRALDQGAASWPPDTPYSPAGAITWSRESNATLNHGNHGPLRDFSMPNGFIPRRWSDHTKLSGGTGFRLYFHPERTEEMAVVLIGYFGGHLPTVRFGS